MPVIIFQAPVYKFLALIDHLAKDMEKKILDCGAGGRRPPLALFHEHGFKSYGIDISENQIRRANEFAHNEGMHLNIIRGDMRDLPYEDETFSFVYTYNTIFYLTKKDIKKAIDEIRRVLKEGGLFYVNFMSVEDNMYGEGKELEKGEFLQIEGGEEIVHTFLEDNEIDDYFDGFDFVLREKRYVRMPTICKDYEACYFDCIVQKK